jgi:hypothetical protein
VARLRKDQTEELLGALDSATSGPLEEITVAREKLTVALRIVLESEAGWASLIADAAAREGWSTDRREVLVQAARPDTAADPEAVLWELWDLVTELNERRTLG